MWLQKISILVRFCVFHIFNLDEEFGIYKFFQEVDLKLN